MTKIITLTFNPVIDKTSSVKRIVPDKKLRCETPGFAPGGGGINVARALKNLGGKAQAIYPVGGHSGKFLIDLMAEESIESITTETGSRTRENFIVVDSDSKQQYRFGFPGEAISEKEQENLLQLVDKQDMDILVVSGSLLPGMDPAIVGTVAGIAKKKNAKLVLDTSGEALKSSLKAGVYLLKPNLGELSSLVGKEEVGDDEVNAIARDIIEKGQCEVVVVSMGPQGARLVTKNEILHAAAPIVKKISTLGAGDSMVAGMVWGLTQKWSMTETLKYGVACGTAATITPGSELCRKQDVERLLRCIEITKAGRS